MKIKTVKDKRLILAVLPLAVIAVAGGAFAYSRQSNNIPPPPINTPPESVINYGPPTEEEIQSTEQHKQAITEREEARQNQPPNLDKKAVTPTITYAGQYNSQVEVGALVAGVSEDNGVCTANFSNGDSTVTKTIPAVKNVNSTDCPTITASGNEFSPKGAWSVVVSYQSPVAFGTSESRTIEVR